MSAAWAARKKGNHQERGRRSASGIGEAAADGCRSAGRVNYEMGNDERRRWYVRLAGPLGVLRGVGPTSRHDEQTRHGGLVGHQNGVLSHRAERKAAVVAHAWSW